MSDFAKRGAIPLATLPAGAGGLNDKEGLAVVRSAGTWVVAGADVAGIGVCTAGVDEGANASVHVGEVMGMGGAAFSAGDDLYTDAEGKFTGTGTTNVVARALEDGAANKTARIWVLPDA